MTFVRTLVLLLVIFVSGSCSGRGEARACTRQTYDASIFTVCRYDAAIHDISLQLNGSDGMPLKTLGKLKAFLGQDGDGIQFAMNAGMYDDASKPIGLYVQSGGSMHAISRTDGPGNFHMKPNGVFWTDSSGIHVTATDAYLAARPMPIFATQSGPMLVIDGALHPAITHDGESRNIRNGVGVCAPGTAYFVISEEPVSFGKLARLFRDQLKCRNALYLDGTVSSLWAPAMGRLDDGPLLGPMVVVSKKP